MSQDERPAGDAAEGARRGAWGSGPFSSSRGAVRRPRPWYVRRAMLAGAVVVALIAVAVITDIPTRENHSQRVSDARGFLSEAYGYLDSCNVALTEAFSIGAQVASHRLTAADLFRVPDLLRDDNIACSYTNDDVFQLASMTIPRSLVDSNKFATAVLSWIVPDAYGVTNALITLTSKPGNPAASAELRKYDARLTADRATAERTLAAMEHQLGTPLPALKLFNVPPGPPLLTAR